MVIRFRVSFSNKGITAGYVLSVISFILVGQ